MSDTLWEEAARVAAEDKIQQALDYLRHTERGKSSIYKRNRSRNIIARGMRFLKANFPDSYMHEEDFSDIDFVIEE